MDNNKGLNDRSNKQQQSSQKPQIQQSPDVNKDLNKKPLGGQNREPSTGSLNRDSSFDRDAKGDLNKDSQLSEKHISD